MSQTVSLLTKIIHKPHIILPENTTEKEIERVQKLAEKAETSCMISRALKGNVEIRMEVTIEIADSL